MNIPNGTFSRSDKFNASNDASFFSSSMPLLPHQNLNPLKSYHQPVEEIAIGFNHFNGGIDNALHDVRDSHPIESLLPDEEQFLAGLMDDINLTAFSSTLDDLEEYDLFGSGGGLELETDQHDSLNKCFPSMPQNIFQNGVGSITGEHPCGEHPSRTLFVRNINSTVEDSELRAIFEQYGDIRTLYTT